MSGEQYIRHAPAFVLGGTGVDTGFEQSVLERVGQCGCFVAQRTRQQTDDSVGHDGCGHLASCEDEVTDGIFLGNQVVSHALVNTFVVTAEDDDVLLERELISHLLVEAFAVGGSEDNLIVLPLGGKLADDAVDRLDLQHHSGTKTERIVIDLAMLVKGVVTEIVDVDLAETFVLGTLNDRVVEWRLQQFRAAGDDVDS